MSVWGSVAVAVGTVAVGSMNASKAAKANKDVAQTPTRSTGIEQLLRELTSSTSETGSTSEQQQAFEKLLSDEQFSEAFTNAMQKQTDLASQKDTLQQQTSTTTRGDQGAQNALAGLVQGSSGQGSVDAMINQILRQGKADISNVGTRTGSFGSTTEQLLNNDLITKAAEAGVGQQNIANQQQLEAIKAAQIGTESTTGQLTGSETGKTTETGTSTETGNKTGQNSSSQDKAATSATSGQSTSQTDTTSKDSQTSVNDSYTNPADGVLLSGALNDLLKGGVATDTSQLGPDGLDSLIGKNVGELSNPNNSGAANQHNGQRYWPGGYVQGVGQLPAGWYGEQSTEMQAARQTAQDANQTDANGNIILPGTGPDVGKPPATPAPTSAMPVTKQAGTVGVASTGTSGIGPSANPIMTPAVMSNIIDSRRAVGGAEIQAPAVLPRKPVEQVAGGTAPVMGQQPVGSIGGAAVATDMENILTRM